MSFRNSYRISFIAVWISTLLFNMSWGVVYPIRNVYIHDLGYSLTLIGVLSTAAAISLSVSGFLYGRISDRIGKRKSLITISMGAASLVYLGYLVADSFLAFLVIIVLESWLIGGYSILVDTLVTTLLPEGQRGKIFGRYRISGSIGYAIASALLGTLTLAFGMQSPFIFACFAVGLAGIVFLFVPEKPPSTRPQSVPNSTLLRNLWKTIHKTGVIWLVIADFIATFGSQMAYPFQSIYYKENFNATPGQIGLFATISVLCEIPAMLWLGALSDRYGRVPILTIGFISTTLTWLLIFIAPSLTLIYIASGLNGVGIIRHSTGVTLIADRVNYNERGTLLGLSYAMFGVAGLVAPSLGGVIAEHFGTQSVFMIAAIFSAIAVAFFWFIMRRNPVRVEENYS
jgi:MFS family permease